MLIKTKFYSKFKLLKTFNTKCTLKQTYKFKTITIILFLHKKNQTRILKVLKNNKTIITPMVYKNKNELKFILDRVLEVRLLNALYINPKLSTKVFAK